MPFDPGQGNNLLPLLLQHTLQQRQREEDRLRDEEFISKKRGNEAFYQAVELIPKVGYKAAVSLVGPDLPTDRLDGLKGLDKAFREMSEKEAAESQRKSFIEQGASSLSAAMTGGRQQDESALFSSFSRQADPQTLEELRFRAQQLAAERFAKASSNRPVSFFDTSGNFIRDEIPGTRGYVEAIQQNLRPLTTSVTGQKMSDVFGEDKVLKRQYTEQAQNAAERLVQFSSALREVNRSDPRAFGSRAGVARFLGNVAMQLSPSGDKTLRDQIMRDMTGEDPESLQRLRLVIEQAGASSIEVFTGEGTNRISDKELGITRKILAGMSPTATQDDIATSLRYLVGSELANEQAALVKMNRQPRFRLYGRKKNGEIVDNEKEFNRMEKYLRAQGLKENEALDFSAAIGSLHRALMEQGSNP